MTEPATEKLLTLLMTRFVVKPSVKAYVVWDTTTQRPIHTYKPSQRKLALRMADKLNADA